MKYDVLIIGAGPGGIFSAYELMQRKPEWKVAVLEAGNPLEKRHCPIDGDKVKSCIHCKTCAIMNGFGGAGAFSDGKYNLTNEFGGTLYEYIGKQKAMELMRYVTRSTWPAAAPAPSCTPRRTAASSVCACKTISTCWTPPCGIWARISTTRYWRTCTPS